MSDRRAHEASDAGVDAMTSATSDHLSSLMYAELRALAAGYVRRAPRQAVLQPTALVHEAYLKLRGAGHVDDRHRTHFIALAARTMRQVLIDHHRGEHRVKRCGGGKRITLSGLEGGIEQPSVDADDLNRALSALQELDERAARVVVLRFYGGLKVNEIAELLSVTDRTVRNDWRMARAWLRMKLGGCD